MKWKTTHNWQRKEDTFNDKGEPGYIIECDGCGHRIFILAKWNDFQRELDITFYFMQVIEKFKLKEEFIKSFNKPATPETHNFEIGLHGVMSEDCDMAREWPRLASICEVMEI